MNRRLQASFISFLSISLSVFGQAPLCAQQTPEAYHIETVQTRDIQCTLTATSYAPNLSSDCWLVIVPEPVNSPGQTVNSMTLTTNQHQNSLVTSYDQSVLRRPVLSAVVDVRDPGDEHALTVIATYAITLSARRLAAGGPNNPPDELSDSDRATYLAPTPTTDFLSRRFKKWIDWNGLRRAPDETDLDFARRAFDKIRSLYTYNYDPNQNRKASSISSDKTADCGGLSNLYVAALRQASIPARIDVGRWAYSSDPIDPLHDMHVKSEFFANGIGWVPVEMSGAVSNKTDAAELYFGCDTGQFVTMSVDTDYVIDTQNWGTKRLLALQGVCVWSSGTGSFDGSTQQDQWVVHNLPQPIAPLLQNVEQLASVPRSQPL